jgi:hypothetical protein
MILIGVSWFLWWFLVQVMHMDSLLAALIVAVAFILVGLVVGEKLNIKRS